MIKIVEADEKQGDTQNTTRLSYIGDGMRCKVIALNAGPRATQRLSGLGITPGTILTVDGRGPFGGPLRISFRGTQLAIGNGLAKQVIVVPY